MRIYIRDQNDAVLDVLDDTYYDLSIEDFLKGKATVLSFSMVKDEMSYKLITTGKNLSFVYDGAEYWLTCMIVEQDEHYLTVTAWSIGLEYNIEAIGPYKSPKAMTFVEYLNLIDFEKVLTIGINEVSDKKISYEWTGTDKKLARLYSLANVFDAEIAFVTRLNDDGSLKQIVINVYHEHDDAHQGVGNDRRNETFYFGEEIRTIKKTEDKTGLYTAITATGKDGLTIATIDREVKDENGLVLYKTVSKATTDFPEVNKIYAVQARLQFPSTVKGNDRWTVNDADKTEYSSAEALYGYMLSQLKANSVPKVTWEIEGNIKAKIGDTVRIADEGYKPTLYLEARVIEQVRKPDNPEQNKSTFSNVKELQSQFYQSLLDRVNALIEQAKPYTLSLMSDNGVTFKNSEGKTTLSAIVYNVTQVITPDVTVRWYKDDVWVKTGYTLEVKASDINAKAVYKAIVIDTNGKERATQDVTVFNVDDGKGIKGKPVLSYAGSASINTVPTTWQATIPNIPAGSYLWTREVTTYTDDTTSEVITPVLMGPQGDDGKTQYTHIAYANSADGKTDFSTTDSARSYIGMYVDQTEADSTDATKYNWTLVKGADGTNGTPGKPGTDGKTPFFHTAYAYSADGTDGFTTVYPNLNLFTGTSDKPSTSTGGSWNVSVIGVYKTPKVGQEYTLAVEVPKAEHKVVIEVYRFNNAGGRVGVLTSKFINSGEKAYITFTWPDPTDSGATQVAAGLAWTKGTDTGTYLWCKAKLEIGNTATPYMQSASEVTTADWPSYIGQYTDFTQDDSTKPSNYTWSLIRGNDGKDGKGIIDSKQEWAASTSGTTAPTTWQTTIPTVTAGQYMWGRITDTWSDNNKTYKFTIGKIGENGQNAQMMFTSATTNQMMFNSDNTPKTAQSSVVTAKYQNVTGTVAFTAKGIKTDGTSETLTLTGSGDSRTITSAMFKTNWVMITVTATLAGLTDTLSIVKVNDGANGIGGKNGYFHSAWAMSADGRVGFSTTDSTGKWYIGTYFDFVEADSTDPTRYNWLELAGAVNMHFAYAWSPDGKDRFTRTFGDTTDLYTDDYDNAVPRYIGRSIKDSNNPSDYKWEPNPERKPWTSYAQGLNGEGLSLMPYGDNKILNSSFESSGLSLSTVNSATQTYDTSKKHSGNRSVKVVTSTTTTDSGLAISYSGLTVGTKYILSVYVYTDNDNMTLRLRIANTSFMGQEQKTSIAKAGWRRVDYTFIAEYTSGLYLLMDQNVTFWVDDIKLELANTMNIPTPWTLAPSEDPLGAIPKYVGTAVLPYEDFSKYAWDLNPAWLQQESNNNLANKVENDIYNNDQSRVWEEISNRVTEVEAQAIQDSLANVTNAYTDFVSTGGKHYQDLANLKSAINTDIQKLADKVLGYDFVNTWFRIGDGGLSIGEVNSNFEILVSNDQITFYDSGTAVAYVSNQSFFINSGMIVDDLQIGKFKFAKVNDNLMGLFHIA